MPVFFLETVSVSLVLCPEYDIRTLVCRPGMQRWVMSRSKLMAYTSSYTTIQTI